MIVENKFIVGIKIGENYIYEIAKQNLNGVLMGEYLIEILKNNLTNDINKLNNYIFQIILKNGIQKLISIKNPIKISSDFFFNLHAKNDDYSKQKISLSPKLYSKNNF